MKKGSLKFYWEDTLLEMLPSRALLLPETKELLIRGLLIISIGGIWTGGV